MEKRGKGQNKKSILAIRAFTAIFAGILLSIMAAMMYIGGGIHINSFLDTGNVYDFSQKDLKKTSKGWLYDETTKGFWLQNNHALEKYLLDGKEQCWGYLYLTVSEMGLPELQGRVIYYNAMNQQIGEQPVLLHKGENIILLPEELPMYRIGIRILDAKGQFISIQSMQIREKALGYTSRRFAKLFSIAFAGYLAVCACILVFWNKAGGKFALRRKAVSLYVCLTELLQYIYQLFMEGTAQHISCRIRKNSKNRLRVFLFSILFVLMVAGNVLGWDRDKDLYRYHLYACFLLLAVIGAVSWERPLRMVSWKKPLAAAWLILWIGVAISDFFVKKEFGMVGIAMVSGGGFFLFIWGNMEKKEQMVYNMIDALGKTFWVAVPYCMLFRVKKPAVHYNGIFCTPEEFSAYAVLMLSVFLVKMDIAIKRGINGKHVRQSCVINICGGAVAFFFTLRAGNLAGNLTAIILLVIFAVRQFTLFPIARKGQYRLFSYLVQGCVAAFLMVCIVHISIKNLPLFLELEVEYKKETLIASVDDETIEELNAVEPGMMDGVKLEGDTEQQAVWRNYIRKWNLLGNSGDRLKVFRSYALPNNGYLYISYKYGLFLLVPYVLYQICLLAEGAQFCFRKMGHAKEGAAYAWICMVGILFTMFGIYGNLEFVAFGHPLWLCYYFGAGCLFTGSRK